MAKSPEEMAASMIASLNEKTGKTLSEWNTLLASKKDTKHSELVRYLKQEHGITHGYANLIAHKVKESDAVSISGTTDLVDNQYSGEKRALRSIYESLISIVQKFGDDIEISPKKTYVSLRRKKQFALIQPSTKTRIDVGINLKGIESKGRLETSGSFNAMVSHRVRISKVSEVNTELAGWLKSAYDAS